MANAETPVEWLSEIVQRNRISDSMFTLTLKRPHSFTFLPGQRIRIYHQARERDYSLASSPSEKHLLLLVRHVRKGPVSTFLSSAPVGTPLPFSGPLGYFLFRPSPRPAVFAATGTGIAPFISMVRSGVSGMMVLHGVNTPEGLVEKALFRQASSRYVPCVSGGAAYGEGESGMYRGHVTDFVRLELAAGRYDFYFCGRSEMIRDAVLLVDDRFPDSLIYSEAFY